MYKLICLIIMLTLFQRPALSQKSIYEFRVPALDGEDISFERYRGKWMLIVNTASKCGFTPQYADLEKLHEQYGDRLAVLGFPANNFFWQEPGSNRQISEFCERNYGVKFQMFSKVSVRGSDQHPLYKWLSAKAGESPGWNFGKYLISPAGDVVAYFSPKTVPLASEITRHFTKP